MDSPPMHKQSQARHFYENVKKTLSDTTQYKGCLWPSNTTCSWSEQNSCKQAPFYQHLMRESGITLGTIEDSTRIIMYAYEKTGVGNLLLHTCCMLSWTLTSPDCTGIKQGRNTFKYRHDSTPTQRGANPIPLIFRRLQSIVFFCWPGWS